MKLQESTDEVRFMLDITVTSKGIEKLLSNLNHHEAAGPDQIKPIILTNLSTPLSPILKHLFQQSLDSGTLPPIWKDANVTHVYKKGERSNPGNYRPISLTCILGKTLEHIVASSVTKHLSKLNIFYELQHGFREKRSYDSQLHRCPFTDSNISNIEAVQRKAGILVKHDYGQTSSATEMVRSLH